ncbi:proline-rich protein 2-like [Melospiza melodia melodia]|uniref:proline-rich protein 2-like n=1 Tax=Melospiza melodia melodia TaxID=1914991 RepID=UPI002FD588B2
MSRCWVPGAQRWVPGVGFPLSRCPVRGPAEAAPSPPFPVQRPATKLGPTRPSRPCSGEPRRARPVHRDPPAPSGRRTGRSRRTGPPRGPHRSRRPGAQPGVAPRPNPSSSSQSRSRSRCRSPPPPRSTPPQPLPPLPVRPGGPAHLRLRRRRPRGPAPRHGPAAAARSYTAAAPRSRRPISRPGRAPGGGGEPPISSHPHAHPGTGAPYSR